MSREVALYDAKNSLSTLVSEVEASGEEIVITRHGKPAAKLTPVKSKLSAEEVQAVLAEVIAARDALAAAHPETLTPMTWEELKAEMYPDD